MRLNDIAKELGKQNKDLISFLSDRGVKKSPMSNVSGDEETMIRRQFGMAHSPRPENGSAKPPAEAAVQKQDIPRKETAKQEVPKKEMPKQEIPKTGGAQTGSAETRGKRCYYGTKAGRCSQKEKIYRGIPPAECTAASRTETGSGENGSAQRKSLFGCKTGGS